MSLRTEVFARSYDEVLSALKHQDDKLNRTLTAIAFLTAAGVTLYLRSGQPSKARPRYFAESTIDIRGFFFVVFLLSVVFAVTLALAAIGPSGDYPWPRRKESGTPESLIFYALIARNPDWDRCLNWNTDRLRLRLATNFHQEARTLAHRVNYKVARSRESGAFVLLTVVSLSLLGIFSVEAFSLATRWWIAVALLLALLVLPFFDVAYMQLFKYASRTPAWQAYALLAACTAFATMLLALAPSHRLHWPAVIYALVALLCPRLAVVHKWFAPFLLGGSALGGFVLILVYAW